MGQLELMFFNSFQEINDNENSCSFLLVFNENELIFTRIEKTVLPEVDICQKHFLNARSSQVYVEYWVKIALLFGQNKVDQKYIYFKPY